jgi:gas vesicle protein
MGKKLALGAVVGAVAGVVAGVLMAPKSGKETRSDIKKKAGDLKEKAEKTAKSVKPGKKKSGAKKS